MTTRIGHQNGVIRICVDRLEGEQIGGRVLSQRLTAPMDFSDLGSLLLQLEALLERQNFPQAFQRIRSFTGSVQEHAESLLPEGALTKEAVERARGKMATFVLHILTRRNATWQCVLEWLEGERRAWFSSELELLKALNGHLEEAGQEKPSHDGSLESRDSPFIPHPPGGGASPSDRR